MTINVTRSSMPEFEEYCNEIKDLWDSHWLTNMGQKHERLQKELEAYLSCKNVVLFTNGHLALEGIIEAMNFPKGSEIITTPFTFASTTHAITRTGHIPVFCDIEDKTYTLDSSKIENLITDKTKAIIPVHVYGNICNVTEIERIAKKHDLKVIYDAAHAFGVKYKGESSASFGDAAIFSFHATKVFNTIEGGAVCFKNDSIREILDDIKDFGIHGAEDIRSVGGNAKMNEFQAAMGLCNLRCLDSEIKKREQVFRRYQENLGGIKGINIPVEDKDTESNYAYYPVVFDGFSKNRNEVYEKLKSEGINSRKYFYPLTNSFECYRDLKSSGADKTPVAKKIGESVLTLPMYADLSLFDVDRICKIILS